MIDQFTNLEPDGDLALPTSSLDLSARMRDLRARQGLKQSEVARRMGLDPSIPSLWEQGKRLVPANRVRALANALEVSLEELLEGVTGAGAAGRSHGEQRGGGLADFVDERGLRLRGDRGPLYRLLAQVPEEPPAPPLPEPEPEPWVIAERPPLVGWIPEGWEPSERVQDISPELPDGYWLDPVKLERRTAKRLLRSRLCASDQEFVGERGVPGAALAERIFQHCSREPAFLSVARLPVVETIFRAVLAAEHGGLADGALVEMLRERGAAVPVSSTLLRRLRDSVRPYPIRRVDADLFGGRR
jgi:transcriptional regulator with XRE-family HTH domain